VALQSTRAEFALLLIQKRRLVAYAIQKTTQEEEKFSGKKIGKGTAEKTRSGQKLNWQTTATAQEACS